MDWEKILNMLDKVEEILKESEKARKIRPKIYESTIIKWIYYTVGKLYSFAKEYDERYEEYKQYYYSLPRYKQRYAKPPYGGQSKWEALGEKTREALHEFMEKFRRVGAEKVAVVIDRDEIFSRAEYGDEAILKISEFEDIVYYALNKVVKDIIIEERGFGPYYEGSIEYTYYLDD